MPIPSSAFFTGPHQIPATPAQGQMPASPSHPHLPLAEGASKTIEQSLLVKIEFMHEKRRAVSPIVATVLTIAMAVVASFAVGGFVFGTISQSQIAPQVTVTGQSFPASAFVTGGSTTTFTCATIPSGAYLSLTNTGSAKGKIGSRRDGRAGECCRASSRHK